MLAAERDVAARSLVAAGHIRAGAVGMHMAGVIALAIGVIAVAAAHWWNGSFGAWAGAFAWCLLAAVACLLASPVLTAPNADRAERRSGTILVIAAFVCVLAAFSYSFLDGTAAEPLVLLSDLLLLVGWITYAIAGGRRLRGISEWTGHDVDEGGLVAQAGPFLLGVFLVSAAYLLTHFFRRVVDAIDVYAVALAAWLIWRATAILWHSVEASSARTFEVARRERWQGEAPSSRKR